jgi:hypothetical protein
MRAVVGRMPLWMDEGCNVETAMLTDRDWAEYRAKGLKSDGAEDRRGSGAQGMLNNPDGDENAAGAKGERA